MTDKKLLTNLAKLGLPMFEPSEELDTSETLAEVVKSHDTRLWECFPVLVANAIERDQFAPEKVKEYLSNKEESDHFHRLVLLSFALYSLYHLSSRWRNYQNFSSGSDRKAIKSCEKDLANNRNLHWNEVELSTERVKEQFDLYFTQRAEKNQRRKEKLENFSLEYALSQIFSPKQKELFKRKLDGDLLTKTEQEYYSRTVKKKVVALANAELHGLARKLLEQ